MYCKYLSQGKSTSVLPVLIVAKCIVNYDIDENWGDKQMVLIVAKCIVNLNGCITLCPWKIVLIVAKCIVN